MKNLLILLLFVGCAKISGAQNLFNPYQSKEKLQADVETVIKDFNLFMKEKGVEVSFTPGVKIDTKPFLIKWDQAGKRIILPHWDELLDEQKALFKEWRAEDAEQFFTSMFNWFFVPHELGHFVEINFNKNELSRYREEVAANEFAIAFLLQKKENRDKLEYIKKTLTEVLEILPPVDMKGMTEEAYFNSSPQQLMNPNVYGYFQFSMILRILEKPDAIDLSRYY